jgi:hypothetical protein
LDFSSEEDSLSVALIISALTLLAVNFGPKSKLIGVGEGVRTAGGEFSSGRVE